MFSLSLTMETHHTRNGRKVQSRRPYSCRAWESPERNRLICLQLIRCLSDQRNARRTFSNLTGEECNNFTKFKGSCVDVCIAVHLKATPSSAVPRYHGQRNRRGSLSERQGVIAQRLARYTVPGLTLALREVYGKCSNGVGGYTVLYCTVIQNPSTAGSRP